VNRVLISYSGTKEAAMAMKRFAQLRPWPEATIKIVSFGFEEEEAMPLLIDSTSYLRAHGYDPEAESLPGTARAGLVPYAAEWGADLIVMGSISRSRIAKLVFGGATEAVITQATVPLFISQ
jgi:nucleotide-binding universal stress UspA family protein